MNSKWIVTALGACAMIGAASNASAQTASGAENSLIGIKLYDSGLRVVSIYGTPDSVQAVSGGNTAIGPGGGGAGAPAGGRGGAPAGGGGGMSGGQPTLTPPGAGNKGGPPRASTFDFADTLLQRPSGSEAAPLNPDGGGSGAPAPGGGGGVGAAGSPSGRILFTRWVYNRSGSKYGFVLDKSNRVVQIEAIGMSNARVKTARGIGFGSTFAQLIKKYNAPDGYEINGENIVVRFLRKNKVAFRLSRLGPNKPQVVTGIVVAAGKT